MSSRTLGRARASTWLEFWNGAQRLYVNDRHREVHYRDTAAQIVALIPGGHARVLDYGPGDALFADRIAAAAAHVFLCEAADGIRRELANRFAGNERVTVIGAAGLAEVASGSIDLMVVNSVVQYLSGAEFDKLLAEARRVLAPGGRLLIGDVVPKRTSLTSEIVAMLRFGAREHFLAATLLSLVATAFSPYSRIRLRLGLSRYDEADMLALLRSAGFAGRRHYPNLSHNPTRLTFLATA
ncbi:MAG TPA: methyltransferase domain-containing protein [Pilimelia sp.]|nr:methyltransferase domain-containing protein [Pilimelia sp.]